MQKDNLYNLIEHELSQLQDHEVKVLFKTGAQSRQVNEFEIKELFFMPYWFVKVELNEHFKNFELTTILEKALKYSGIDLEVCFINTQDQMKLICYLFNTLSDVFEMEQNQFKTDPDPLAIAAGSESFNIFGEYNALNSLSNGDVTKWDNLKMQPYEYCFMKLLMNKTQAQFDKKYAELVREKNKNKKK